MLVLLIAFRGFLDKVKKNLALKIDVIIAVIEDIVYKITISVSSLI